MPALQGHIKNASSVAYLLDVLAPLGESFPPIDVHGNRTAFASCYKSKEFRDALFNGSPEPLRTEYQQRPKMTVVEKLGYFKEPSTVHRIASFVAVDQVLNHVDYTQTLSREEERNVFHALYWLGQGSMMVNRRDDHWYTYARNLIKSVQFGGSSVDVRYKEQQAWQVFVSFTVLSMGLFDTKEICEGRSMMGRKKGEGIFAKEDLWNQEFEALVNEPAIGESLRPLLSRRNAVIEHVDSIWYPSSDLH